MIMNLTSVLSTQLHFFHSFFAVYYREQMGSLGSEIFECIQPNGNTQNKWVEEFIALNIIVYFLHKQIGIGQRFERNGHACFQRGI